MDNLETTSDPQGEAGVTASSGQSEAQETQPVETEAGHDETQSDEAVQYPWESDEKFKGKSPDDIWKSYQESQKVVGQASQKAAVVNTLEKYTGMTASEIQDFISKQEQTQLAQEAKTNPSAYLMREVSQLKNQIAYQNEEKALEEFLRTNDGKPYAPFKDKILNLGLKMETDKPYSEIAKDYFGSAIAQGQQTAYKKIENKKATQATGARSTPSKKFTLDDMKNMSSKEMESILPHAPER